LILDINKDFYKNLYLRFWFFMAVGVKIRASGML
jgi:hypothetical protein